jgi:GntR family transcriptional regulator
MFQLDGMSRTPVYEQITSQFEEYVLRGVLKAGDRLPSVRSLSVELSINPNTIQKAYMELDRRGLTCSVPGKGVYVSDSAHERICAGRREGLSALALQALELKQAGVSLEEVLGAITEEWNRKGEQHD